MTTALRGFLLASLSISVLALGACASTGGDPNVSNRTEANRLDSILERAAREARASGDKVETLALLEKIYERNQNDAAIATGYGQALREDEQLNRARQILYPFTEGKNAYPDAVTELAMVQLALGQYKDAELTSRRAVELDPSQGRPYLALGTALDAQNYHEQAEVAFRKGIDKWKGDPTPIMNNLALNLASQNKLDQAIDMLAKAKEISPGRIELERNLRIVRTLKEDATEFTDKQEAEKKADAEKAIAKKEEARKQALKKEALKKEAAEKAAAEKTKEAAEKTTADSEKKEPENKATREEPVKKQATPKTTPPKKETAPDKLEPAATGDVPVNARGSRQNFN